jgi:hypothetical protein
MNPPMQLPYTGAASLVDATSETVAEARDPATAAWLRDVVNAAWRYALSTQGSYDAHRQAHDALVKLFEEAPQ